MQQAASSSNTSARRTTTRVVARDDTVKGYEFAKDQYVVFSTEEIKALEEKATGMIDIVEFVPLAKVDREYVDQVVLTSVRTRAAIAPIVCSPPRSRTPAKPRSASTRRAASSISCCCVRQDGVLVMEQLHYADEVRSTNEVTIPAGDVKPTELALAKQLIEQTATDTFEPAKFKDTVRERVMEPIQKKIEGQDITQTEAPADTGGKIIDLMEALKASLAASNKEDETRVKAS